MTFESSKNPSSSSPAEPSAGWWRTPWMWLVVGGPAVVVVAGFITLAIAVSGADPVLSGTTIPPVHLRQATGTR